ncbi:heavy-metal-associated domain-containing protein [Cytophaga aurantiaca]|uniref:heavy-metal-associated domain-containing protein n=1 Tax=Cytophaga aurantiaca TaxID=29530 RepID=UPI0012FA9BDC|nr:cation transporter [Cytophaga aurantiaca]
MKKILLIVFIASMIMACTSKPNAEAEFYVRGNCDMCKERIDKTALVVKGVSSADWNEETSVLKVAYDSTQTSSIAIEKAIAATGHATKGVAMDSIAHKALPECCQEHAKEMH